MVHYCIHFYCSCKKYIYIIKYFKILFLQLLEHENWFNFDKYQNIQQCNIVKINVTRIFKVWNFIENLSFKTTFRKFMQLILVECFSNEKCYVYYQKINPFCFSFICSQKCSSSFRRIIKWTLVEDKNENNCKRIESLHA